MRRAPALVVAASSAFVVALQLDAAYLLDRWKAVNFGETGEAPISSVAPASSKDGMAAWIVFVEGSGSYSTRRPEAGRKAGVFRRDGRSFLADDGGFAVRRAFLIGALGAFLLIVGGRSRLE